MRNSRYWPSVSTLPLHLILLIYKPATSFSFSIPSFFCRSSSLIRHLSSNQNEVATVALTRERGRNAKLEKVLLNHPSHIKTIELPCIEHALGSDYEQFCVDLFEERWSCLIVTSPESARVVAGVWNTCSFKRHSQPSVASVGPATRDILETAGISVAFTPSKATGETLVQELPPSFTRIVYPTSQKAPETVQEGLELRGCSVKRYNTYDTLPAVWTPEEARLAQSVVIACFASPSAVQAWIQNTGFEGSNVYAACIGKTTASACQTLGWSKDRIVYPDLPGVSGWAEAVIQTVRGTRGKL